ncbi:VPA1269 family protein [Paucibacter sp. B51]|uniref:VPA1269 family protein n=1 Tax=Paucibacter sp. B51 TaxID=2993315 RepID=UPI0022EBB7F2|nr:VPA1269 family protein [Paucibacter sp. B51]
MSDVASFTSFGGQQTWLNRGSNHRVLRVPTRDELRELLEEFRRHQLAWLREYLCAPVPGRDYLFGLTWSKVKGQSAKNGQRPTLASLHVIGVDAVPPNAWEVLKDVQPEPDSPDSTRLLNAPLELQKSFLLAAMGTSLDSIGALLRPVYRDALVFGWLTEAFEKNRDPSSFLDALIARSAYERSRQRSSRNFMRCSIPDLFLYWLAQHSIVLFPLASQPIIGDVRGNIEDRLTSPEIHATWNALAVAHADAIAKSPATVLPRLRVAFRTLTLASTLRTADDVSLELFEAAYALMNQRFDRAVVDMLHRIYRPLRDGLGRKELPTFKPRRSLNPELEHPFAWTRLDTRDYRKSTFPKGLAGPYSPMPHVIAWGDRFATLLAKLPIKSVGNTVSTLQRFLVWLAMSGARVDTLSQLRREHINDGKALSDSQCFRAHLSRDGTIPETSNAHLLRLSWSFQAIIEEDRLDIANPVNIRFDGFKVPFTRGKSPRRPMGRDLMNLLRKLNRQDDYALSRSFEAHHRSTLNAEGKYEPIWFPGFAVIVDLLLQLPLRGFQARFLDSGEGDELIATAGADGLELQPNPLSTATVKRREGLFYLFDAKDGTPTLGIYVNTNKTSVDRASGYEIAWCSPELQESLRMLRDWQIEHNPVAKPVHCMEKHEYSATENPEVIAGIKTTFALFRDPEDPQGWPISRDKLFDYWSRLLAYAEDVLTAEGKPVRLTETKEVSKGPNKAPVTKRLAAYDIHTLRVSGISALIEAGMPPDLVQEVAGHATLVMTLYYNKIKAARLNESLSKHLDLLSKNLDSIDGMEEAEYERLAALLVNNRAPEDAFGKTLLRERRGKGDGAVEVMIHGICPGGDCSTGGDFLNQALGYGPVPRAAACSLCRYRLTGPMFLPGLVLNANRLVHELRTKGKEIGALNEERERLDDCGKPTHSVKARIEELYRETDIVATEWAAEVQYVHVAERLFESFLAEQSSTSDVLPALIGGVDCDAVKSKITNQSELNLLQSLAEGADFWPGFRPTAALTDHREFLNEVLTASGVDPFLLKLRGTIRDKAAVMLGRIVTTLVPDERHNDLRSGTEKLEDYPSAAALLNDLRKQVQRLALPNKSADGVEAEVISMEL